jgi:aryl-alcohol dehydrogenase-like predicted oxidoreductase
MRHKLLGRSGLRVSELCLGAMTFGGGSPIMPGGATDEDSRAMFDMFAEAGGTFIDTAVSYSLGRSEQLLGDFLKADRDHFVVATKYTNAHTGGLMASGNSRRNMMMSVEKSLRQLQTDRIDLLWLHVWDYTTPVEEVMRGFEDLVASGKVLYVGFSDTPAWEVSRANMMADLRGWAPAVAIQIERSLMERTSDHDLMSMARSLDLGVAAWSPLAGGVLARSAEDWESGSRQSRRMTEHDRAIVEAVNDIARELGTSASAVAIAALMHDPLDQQVFPIIGARTPAQLAAALAASDVTLSPEQWDRLDSLARPSPIFPYGMIDGPVGARITTGGEAERLVNHRRRL